ncbi:hypothetical protein Brsp01_10310 [Brucella sp. NBRC 12950]|nr:hypothetical protein Brsp01_10310 [Brucella sp. NBRC 12950]
MLTPAYFAGLSMIANYQSGPEIYKYVRENRGVWRVALVAANEFDLLSQRDSDIEAAKALGLLDLVEIAGAFYPGGLCSRAFTKLFSDYCSVLATLGNDLLQPYA